MKGPDVIGWFINSMHKTTEIKADDQRESYIICCKQFRTVLKLILVFQLGFTTLYSSYYLTNSEKPFCL